MAPRAWSLEQWWNNVCVKTLIFSDFAREDCSIDFDISFVRLPRAGRHTARSSITKNALRESHISLNPERKALFSRRFCPNVATLVLSASSKIVSRKVAREAKAFSSLARAHGVSIAYDPPETLGNFRVPGAGNCNSPFRSLVVWVNC